MGISKWRGRNFGDACRNEDELASLLRYKAFNATCPLKTQRKRYA
jgi:hypothetical protein